MKKTMKLKQYDFKVLLGEGNVNAGFYAKIEVLACNRKEAAKKAEEKCKEYNLTLVQMQSVTTFEPFVIHPKTIQQ